jgi:hypothetical protein
MASEIADVAVRYIEALDVGDADLARAELMVLREHCEERMAALRVLNQKGGAAVAPRIIPSLNEVSGTAAPLRHQLGVLRVSPAGALPSAPCGLGEAILILNS